MSILSNYIIQDLIQNVSKGVTETFKFVSERYNSNDVLPIHYILMTIVHIWGGLLTLFLITKN